MRYAEEGIKKFQFRIPFKPDPGKKIPKKFSKKIQKIKKPLSGIISCQNGMRQAEKGRKKFQARIPLILDPSKKIPKNIAKKIKKPLSGIMPKQNGMRQAEKGRKKILGPNSAYTGPREVNSEKNSKKIQKIEKTSFRHYFQPKWDEIGREREKNFSLEFRSYSTQLRKF